MSTKLRNRILNVFSEPDDVYKAIRPLYICSKVMGLACYTTKTENRQSYRVTLFAMAQNVFIAVAFTILCTYNSITQPGSFYGSDIMVQVQNFQDIVSNLLASIQLIFVIVFAEKIVQVFSNIDAIDRQFRNMNVLVSYKLTYIVASINAVLCTLLPVIGMSAYVTLVDTNETFVFRLLRGFINLIPSLINLIFQFQYFQYTSILSGKYKLLNKYLKSLLREEKLSVVAWAENVNKITTVDKNIIKKQQNPIVVIDTVVDLHIRLNDTCHLINCAFCVQLLFSITIAFIGIVTALFLIAVNFSRPSDDSEDWNMMFTIWAFWSAINLIWTVYITCNLCEKANKCPKILHRIRNNSTDTQLNDTIEVYSLHMYHNRLQFNVCGLFPLDYTLLYTIVAGITTYLVILIQFNNAAYLQKGSEIINPNTTENAIVKVNQ